MQEVIFEVQTVTPLFMAGADQGKAEIRDSSFRGDMRYWYRALVGGLETGADALERLKDAENGVFGATDRGSAIQIRVMDRPTRYNLLPREGNRENITGRDYLFWSVLHSKRPCFSSGTSFRVMLAMHSSEKEKQVLTAFKQAVSAFWLLTHLGGIGSRARRCGGSLVVAHVTGDTFGLPFDLPTTAPELQRLLNQGIAESRALYDRSKRAGVLSANYDILAPETCKIWILLNKNSPWDDANQALRDIGESLRLYRKDSMAELQERKIFGIPVMKLSYDERGNPRSRPIRITGAGDYTNRIASPLHLRLSALQTNKGWQYVGVASLFQTKWKNMSEQEFKLYQHIENWRKTKFPTALEVEL